ncbi:hypothetical protein MKX01_036768 [Papaver californicum]|nr:hypothetical protein MKX01_036768 [Papaver californicum]
MMDDDEFVDMGSSLINNNTGWLIDYMDEVQDTTSFIFLQCRGCPGELLHIFSERNETSHENSPRAEPLCGLKSKACREKIRRDKLNDRFLELCSILEPGRPPTTDKIIVLSKAIREEKSELREEKVRLKAETEKMDKTLKEMGMPSPILSPLAAFHESAAFSTAGKTVPYQINYPPIAMWKWIPPSSLDTSQDHVLRPPVA